MIAIDNTLWNGSVAQPAVDDSTKSLQVLSQKLLSDDVMDLSLAPIDDSLRLLRKQYAL